MTKSSKRILNLIRAKKYEFPVIIGKRFNDDYTLLKLMDEHYDEFFKNSINMSIEDACKAMLGAGIIDDYNNDIVMVDRYKKEAMKFEEDQETEETEILEYISQLSLDDCSRIAKVFFDNKCYIQRDSKGLPI